MTKNQQISYDIYQPFGPSVMKASVPQVAVDLVNKISDDILKDKKKRLEMLNIKLLYLYMKFLAWSSF